MPTKPPRPTSADEPRPPDDHPQAPATPPPGRRLLRNALEAWATETPGAAVSLEMLRLGADPRLLVPITAMMGGAKIHYVPEADLGYVHCRGEECILCRLGRQAEHRDLIPVYDPVARHVAVLAVSNNLRPGALRPQLTPVLRRLADGSPPEVISVRRVDRVAFSVEVLPLPEGVDDGAPIIADFLRRLEAGEVDLGAVYPTVADEDLRWIPEIALQLRLRGIA